PREESVKCRSLHVQMYTYEMSLEEIRMKGVLSMRKVIAGLFIALDGVVESPDKWQEHFDEDMGQAMTEQLASQDAVLLGRVTYQEWASYWPTAPDAPFA